MLLLIFAIFIFIFIILKLKSPSIKGSVGEFRVEARLKFLDGENYKVLNDVLLKNKSGRTSQIDHIIILPFGIFVIETKNYKDSLFFQEEKNFNFFLLEKRDFVMKWKITVNSEF